MQDKIVKITPIKYHFPESSGYRSDSPWDLSRDVLYTSPIQRMKHEFQAVDFSRSCQLISHTAQPPSTLQVIAFSTKYFTHLASFDDFVHFDSSWSHFHRVSSKE